MWTLTLHFKDGRTLMIPNVSEQAKSKALLQLLDKDDPWLTIWHGSGCQSYPKHPVLNYEWTRTAYVDVPQTEL